MDRSKKTITLLFAIWDTAWKGVATYRAIRNRQYRWIAPLLLVNSAGILPMLYLVWFAKRPGEGAAEA